MPDEGHIEFNAEGGFRATLPNGRVVEVPVEQAKKIFFHYYRIAAMNDTWGLEMDEGLSSGEVIAKVLKRPEQPWGLLDHGNLIRVARATEMAAAHVAKLAREMHLFRKDMREMMKFWKELRQEYRRQKDEPFTA